MLRTAVALSFAAAAVAQANAVPGLDVRLYDMVDAACYGRHDPPYPGGVVGINLGHGMCNSGTVAFPWLGIQPGGVLLQTCPKIASLLVRESGGRMVQISRKSFCKHSRIAFNSALGPCQPCQPGPTGTWRPGCGDVYSSGFSNLGSLGPTEEIDPWLGTWNPVGSYFDRGDPPVGGAQATDGILSPITNDDPIYNRMLVTEADLTTPGTFWGQVHLVVIGEPVTNRGDDQLSRQVAFTWNGTAWSAAVTGAGIQGPVLTRWTGATTALGGNGNDDGRFMVAVKVTGPVDGFWHYEFAVHDIDNASGGASFRVPICPTARVRAPGFHDIDHDAGTDWAFARNASEVAWTAPAGNPLDWNTIYNFWFDCDAAPVAGSVAIDRARLGPGALTVTVASQVPGLLGQEYTGAGCGSPAPSLEALGVPAIPAPGYGVRVQGAPGALTALLLAVAPDATPLGSGCVRRVDPLSLTGSDALVADAGGGAQWSLPISSSLLAVDVWAQAAQVVPGGPVFGGVDLSNGLRIRIGGVGCP